MNNRQENRLNMYNNVISIFDLFASIVATFLQLNASVLNFKASVNNINETIIKQGSELSGITKAKQYLRSALIHLLALISASLKAFAHKNKNYELEAEANMSESFISRLTDIFLIEKSNLILTKANLYQASLPEFGTNATEIANLSAAIDEFELKYNNPIMAIERTKYYTLQLAILFSQANDVLLNELDPVMLAISDTHPEFYSLYKNARNIIDRHGKSHKQLVVEGIGTVSLYITAAVDASPVENALVELVVNNQVISTVDSDELGEAYFEAVPAGSYHFKVSQQTYITKETEQIVIQPGDELTIDVALDAIPE